MSCPVGAITLASSRAYLLCTVPGVVVTAYRDRHGTHWPSYLLILVVSVILAALSWPIWKHLEDVRSDSA